MSNRELDNLFKTKLEGLEKAPSANAWDRIQAGKQKKKGKGIWFYTGIAAAIVLLAAFTGIFLFNNDAQTTTTIATLEENSKGEEHSVKTESTLAASDKNEKGSQVLAEGENNAQPEANGGATASPAQQASGTDNFIAHTDQSNNEKRTIHKKTLETGSSKAEPQNNLNSVAKTESTSVKDQNEQLKAENEEIKNLDSHATNSTTVASTNQQKEAEDKGQTITFNIEDFKTATTVAKAEEKEEKKSPLKKVAAFARSLKEGDAGLGELREAKNELFALNFKKENDDSK